MLAALAPGRSTLTGALKERTGRKGKVLRGTWLDIFGHTAERRMERELLSDYAVLIWSLLPKLTEDNLDLLISIAGIPMQIRGYGHVKLASIERYRAEVAALLAP